MHENQIVWTLGVIIVVRPMDRSGLIFDISEILWLPGSQYDTGSTTAGSHTVVPECPTFLVKISHEELYSMCTRRTLYRGRQGEGGF